MLINQRLLDRTRQRREVLQKKLENSPAQRKRKPLSEDQSENIEEAEKQNDGSTIFNSSIKNYFYSKILIKCYLGHLGIRHTCRTK